MKRRTLTDWKRLIELQTESDLSIASFCKQNNLPTSNFYKYRNKLNQRKSSDVFVKAERIKNQPVKAAQMLLTFGETRLTVNDNCDTNWLADLIKALRA